LPLLFLCAISRAHAAPLGGVGNSTGTIIVPKGQVIEHDFTAFGSHIEISGEIDGDLFAFGSQVFIDGVVKGSVILVAGTVTLSGEVTENVRTIGGQILVSGTIGRSLTALGGSVEVQKGATIGRNITTVTGSTDIAGSVDGSARLYSSSVRVSSDVGKDVLAYTSNLRITSTSTIGGELKLYSDNSATIDPAANIEGGVEEHPSFLTKLSDHPTLKWLRIGSKFATLLMNFFYSLILGYLFMRFFPHKVESALRAMKTKPWQALLTGVVAVIILPLLCIVLLITIVGVPFALTLLGIYVLGFYTAKVFTVLYASERVFGSKYRKLCFFLSLVIYFLFTTIPYVGFALSTGAMLFGLGAIISGRTPIKK